MIPTQCVGFLFIFIITHGFPIPSKPVLEYDKEYEGTLTISYGSRKRSTDELDADTVHLQLTVLNSDHKIKLRKTRDSIFSHNFKFQIESKENNVREVRDVTPSQSEINSMESNHYISDEENAIFSINNDTGKVSGHLRDMAVDTIDKNGTQKVIVTKPRNPRPQGSSHDNQGHKDYVILPGYKPLPPLIQGRSAKKSNATGVSHGKVEILVVWDLRLYNYFNQNEAAILEYTALYFRCVNFYYATVKDPKLKYIVTGLRTLTSMEAQEEIIGPKKIKADCEPPKHSIHIALVRFDWYVSKYKKEVPPYDLAMFITSLDLVYTIYESSTCGWDALAGMANLGTVCDASGNVAVGEGGKGFSGVGTVVHEAAHILGALDGGRGIMGNDIRFDWQGWFDATAEKALKRAAVHKGCLKKLSARKPAIPEYKRNTKSRKHGTLLQLCQKYLAGLWNPQIAGKRDGNQNCKELRCQYFFGTIQVINFGMPDDGTICSDRGAVCRNGKCEDRLDKLFLRHKHDEGKDEW